MSAVRKFTLGYRFTAVFALGAVGLAVISGIEAQDQGGARHTEAEAGAMESLDEYMDTFNARDPRAWAATLHYPHVRMAGGEVRVWQDAEEYASGMDFDAFAERFGWHHSAWDEREVVQSSEEKVHVALRFTRYNAADEPIATYESLYVLVLKDGRWGTLARSSFAP